MKNSSSEFFKRLFERTPTGVENALIKKRLPSANELAANNSDSRNHSIKYPDGNIELALPSQLNLESNQQVSILSANDIEVRTEKTRAGLKELAKGQQNQKELETFADNLADRAHRLLIAVANDDDQILRDEKQSNQILEIVVAMDGTRPSFLIQDSKVNLGSGESGFWKNNLDSSKLKLETALPSVGKICINGNGVGTGFLISENLIVTNHHVLEGITNIDTQGNRTVFASATIGFGFEYRCPPGSTRKFKTIPAFYGKHNFNLTPNHNELDLALLELEPAINGTSSTPLGLDLNKYWAADDQVIYVVGYPGRPNLAMDTNTLLQLFQVNQFGCKRLAPGMVQATSGYKDWTACHDASTLQGSSGSAVLLLGNETFVAGLHYGGTSIDTPVNWAHLLGRTLDWPDARTNDTLHTILNRYEVNILST